MTDQLRPSSSSSSTSPAPSSPITAAPSLCTNNCGFYGNPKQEGMCSKCFKTVALKKAAEANAAANIIDSPTSAAASSSPSSSSACSDVPLSTSDSSFTASVTPTESIVSAGDTIEDIPIFRSSVSNSSLPPLSFSDSLTIPLTSPKASPLMSAAPAPSPQPSTTPASDLLPASSSSSLSPPLSSLSLTSLSPAPTPTVLSLPAITVPVTSSDKKRKNRCLQCNIKVGLTYFSCRCDETAMFCATHRYPHSHACAFDHKQQQQEKLTKANPVCAHSKLERI